MTMPLGRATMGWRQPKRAMEAAAGSPARPLILVFGGLRWRRSVGMQWTGRSVGIWSGIRASPLVASTPTSHGSTSSQSDVRIFLALRTPTYDSARFEREQAPCWGLEDLFDLV